MTASCRLLSALCLSVLTLLSARGASALEVKLQVTETDKVARTPAIVTTGVPFARGTVRTSRSSPPRSRASPSRRSSSRSRPGTTARSAGR